MGRQLITILSVVFIALSSVGSARALELRGTIFEAAADRVGLDPLLIYAVAVMESGRKVGDQVVPWPWTVRSAAGSEFAASKADAVGLLTADADIGLGQINARWHGGRVASLDELLDPRLNIEVTADVLRASIDSAPADFVLGLGRYHSWEPERARWYGREVMRIYGRLLRGRDQ